MCVCVLRKGVDRNTHELYRDSDKQVERDKERERGRESEGERDVRKVLFGLIL